MTGAVQTDKDDVETDLDAVLTGYDVVLTGYDSTVHIRIQSTSEAA